MASKAHKEIFSGSNVGNLLASLQKGEGAKDAYKPSDRGLLDEQNGNGPEGAILGALSIVPFITRVDRLETQTPGEKRPDGLKVTINPDFYSSVPDVTVYIRSGNDAVKAFRRKIAEQNQVPDHEITTWFYQNRIVTLDSQKRRDPLRESFMSQIRGIDEFSQETS